MPLMIIYIATCLDDLIAFSWDASITFHSPSGYNESILNTTTIKKKYIRLIYKRSKLLIE
jgi:hypothetical protein